ncbi:hypothetical protein G6045_17245 [Streptomyces sp. YC504]|uniref:Uncharacterized protein n=1 Tax=Streptomyces mesophilus TaxID=1775132 RepID=A0A6G4XJJ2_9ACTN|nr:hypothetical protein [Streptomyces mesophilus]NGO77393.1 hypothetical protein [Streptomyces mesophilus]
MYTLEMAYAHMRSLQELADRSRAHKSPIAAARADKVSRPVRGKKR